MAATPEGGAKPEHELAGDGKLELFTSEALIAELAGILGRPKFAVKLQQKKLAASEIIGHYRALADTVEARIRASPRPL